MFTNLGPKALAYNSSISKMNLIQSNMIQDLPKVLDSICCMGQKNNSTFFSFWFFETGSSSLGQPQKHGNLPVSTMHFFFLEGETVSFYLALAVLELSNSKRSPILPPKCWIKDKHHYAWLKLLYKEHGSHCEKIWKGKG